MPIPPTRSGPTFDYGVDRVGPCRNQRGTIVIGAAGIMTVTAGQQHARRIPGDRRRRNVMPPNVDPDDHRRTLSLSLCAAGSPTLFVGVIHYIERNQV